jgi:hypothetical protein
MCSFFLSAGVFVCAGAQPYLGARIVSGDEMIDRAEPSVLMIAEAVEPRLGETQ